MAKEWPIEDFTHITSQLADLSEKMQVKHAWGATRAGAQVIAEKIKSTASIIDDATTRESIVRNVHVQSGKQSQAKSRGGPYMRVGVLGGSKSAGLTKVSRGARRALARSDAGKKKRKVNRAQPGGDTFYWRFLEFGTKNMAARPFMRPAYGGNQADVVARIASSLEERIRNEKLDSSGGGSAGVPGTSSAPGAASIPKAPRAPRAPRARDSNGRFIKGGG